ncbi:NAD(P)H-dependent oxidoreductase [Globicatella sulfidifaciens]|uniref:NADPH-dependent FMN reductase n=1 Tax=Globicatella sulfidifaciens TaxID=136093 RepID=UPI00288DFE72|nr:NADPH-dependent FMN reductase [Globicatella sulfidifaciens]MDT2767560.1 NAD(P)H-dependent oxidoreductase [Globicatella sulfidifaciens]
MKLIGIVGTNSIKSTNRQLLEFIQKKFSDKAEIELIEIYEFPVFNKPVDKTVPEVVQKAADKIESADGVIISTPEYDHSCPAVLMNAIAWLSYGIYPLLNKPIMITGASYGTLGSSRAQSQLRQILDSPEVKARVLPSSEFLLGNSLQAFDEEGNLKDEKLVKDLEQIFADFTLFIEFTAQLVEAKKAMEEQVKNFSWEK